MKEARRHTLACWRPGRRLSPQSAPQSACLLILHCRSWRMQTQPCCNVCCRSGGPQRSTSHVPDAHRDQGNKFCLLAQLACPSACKGTALLLAALLIGMNSTGARRVLWFGLLSHLASFPPPVVQQILSVIQDGVLSLGSDVPASVRAQAFSDSALAQVLMALLQFALTALWADWRPSEGVEFSLQKVLGHSYTHPYMDSKQQLA